MDLLLGVLLGIGLTLILVCAWRARRLRLDDEAAEAAGTQSALHAAASTLPHLRRGLMPRSAEQAVPYLRALTRAAAIALADRRAVLAIDGQGREQVRPGDLLSRLLERTPDDRMHIEPHLISSDSSCPLRSAVLAPLIVQGRREGTLIAFYRSAGWPSHAELRVVEEAASLVCAQVELSLITEQEQRLAQAELRALRAQISPHFIYNALAAVAGEIHSRPEDARELLIDFADFTRYLFRDGRSYVTLGEELEHVARYLRLEQARFHDLDVRIDVPEVTSDAVVPAMSVQPLAENAVRHGIERRAGSGKVAITARLRGDDDVELRVSDDGAGIPPGRIPAVLAGASGGIGLSNVDGRLRASFGEGYALRIESAPGHGTTVVMTVPHLRGATEPETAKRRGGHPAERAGTTNGRPAPGKAAA